MIRAHKIRLNPTPEQANHFARAAGTRRFVFNWGLEQWKRQYEAGEKPSALELKKQFNAIRKEQFPWSYEVSKCAVEGAFMDLGAAFKNFFEGRKKGRKAGYPKFKAKKRGREGFYLANDKFKVGDHWIDIPKLGRVNLAEKLRFVGKILSGRVTQRAGRWYISITVEVTDPTKQANENKVGIDVGVNRLATLSDGQGFENQKSLRKLLRKVKQAHKDLSRKEKGSKNREKARLRLARLHEKIANRREDWLHKVTTLISDEYGFVALENLNIKGMVKNRHLAQALSDAALGRFALLLASKVETRGGVTQKVGRFFPSSKRCHQCHALNDKLTLADRVFVCPTCGLECDRDYNASMNLLQEGWRLYLEQQQK
jgi:putative transposase